MKLIAESGSTSTNWRVLDNDKTIGFDTLGINPLFLNKQQVIDDIKKQFPKAIRYSDITEIQFYGPGCSTKERCKLVSETLSQIFTNALTEINTDLLAAARALFGKQAGIACILGTGSNSGLYDGKRIIENIPATGYILGDEGSGANLGLRFIKAYLNKKIEHELAQKFEQSFQLQVSDIIDRVYKGAYPNRFLAGFAPFINQNIAYPSIKRICTESFSEFIDWHILPYNKHQTQEISVAGSIASHFETTLQEAALSKGFQFTKIIAKPIDSLVDYSVL